MTVRHVCLGLALVAALLTATGCSCGHKCCQQPCVASAPPCCAPPAPCCNGGPAPAPVAAYAPPAPGPGCCGR